MEALASRVGRLEAQLDHLQRDLASTQTALSVLVKSGTDLREHSEIVERLATPAAALPAADGRGGVTQDAVVAEWVRLFENELEALRRRTDGREGPLSDLELRIQRLEGFRHEGGADKSVVELAEICLGGLQEVQAQVQALQALPSPTTPAGGAPAGGGGGAVGGLAMAQPLALGLFSKQAQIRLGDVEEKVATYESRFKVIEEVLVAHTLEPRIAVLEEEMQEMMPLRRYAVSLRTLEEMGAKIEDMQKAISAIPYDHIMSQVKDGSIESAAREAGGKLSTFDAYRVQAGVEQVMIAMEALTRQRNDDVRLVNQQLEDIYAHVEKELPKNGRETTSQLSKMRTDVDALSSRVEGMVSVQLREIERHALHEARIASEDAVSARSAVVSFEEQLKKYVSRNAATEAKVAKIYETAEQRSIVDAQREASQAQLRSEVSKLRVETSELATTIRGSGNMDPEIRIVMMRTEMQEQFTQLTRDIGDRAAKLERELQSLKRRSRDGADGAAVAHEDFEILSRDVANMRNEAMQADTGYRERIARTERELRAEVRATQRLVLEMADQMRPGTIRMGNAGDIPAIVDRAIPSSVTGVAPRLAEVGAGEISIVADDTAEWYVPDVLGRARAGDNQVLVSRPFAVPRFPGVNAVKLKLFPLGSKRQTQPGHCSVYVTGPKGSHMQFKLRFGAIEHGPLECFFDREEKDTGRHDFCALEDNLDDDGCAVVQLIVMRATSGQSA